MTAPSYVYNLLASETFARWGASSPIGTPTTITFGFPASQPSSASFPNFTQFTAVEIAAARQALAYIGSFTNINFVEVTSGAQLEFGNADLTGLGSGVGGRADYNYTNAGIQHATVFLSNTGQASLANSDFVPGSITSNDIGGHGWHTLLHEIGHALGLKHPFEQNIAGDPNSVMPANLDDLSRTLMSYTNFQPSNVAIVTGTSSSYSYTSSNLTPQTYSLFDIAALQYLYGTDTSSTGNKVFAFSPAAPVFMTIHDNGPNNTIDCSDLTGTNIVDLNPGATSKLAISQSLPFGIVLANQFNGTSAVTIAYEGRVANYTGGIGHDDVTGNAGANVIHDGGGGATDILRGLGGNDTYIVYNAGDTIVESATQGTADRISSGVDFVLGAGVYVELLTTTSSAGTAAIDLTGNALKQEITGNAGANILNDGGAGAADTMRGLGGNDTYQIYNSGDVIVESASQGTVDKVITSVDYKLGAGVYVEQMTTNSSAGTTKINLVGNQVIQKIVGNAGTNLIDGKGGSDTLYGGSGKDYFTFSSTIGAANVDTIGDFNSAADTIRLENAIFTTLTTAGALAVSAFKDVALAVKDASDRVLYNSDTGNLYYDADGSGGSFGAIKLAMLTGTPTLTAADFIVI